MPRSKAANPRRINEDDQESRNWRMGEETSKKPLSKAVEFSNRTSKKKGKSVLRRPLKKLLDSDERLQSLISQASFIAEIALENSACEGLRYGSIGEPIALHLESGLDAKMLANAHSLWIYVSEGATSFVYIEQYIRDTENESLSEFAKRRNKGFDPDVIHYDIITSYVDTELFRTFDRDTTKREALSFQLYFDTLKDDNTQLKISIGVCERSALKLTHPSQFIECSQPVKNTLRRLLDKPQACFEEEGKMKTAVPAVEDLYGAVKEYHKQERLSSGPTVKDVQHPYLRPTLRPYQRLAVEWMMRQEEQHQQKDEEDGLHELFEEVQCREGVTVYANIEGGFITLERPGKAKVQPGGILAEEMGLGKTVEVLALLLCNPRQSVPCAEYLEPILIQEGKGKKKRRKRSPSPVEFTFGASVVQLDGHDDESDNVGGSNNEDDDDEEEYLPPSKKRALSHSLRTSKKSSSGSIPTSSSITSSKRAHRPKASNNPPLESAGISHTSFDPLSVLEGRSITKSSPLGDLILHTIALSDQTHGVKVAEIEKQLVKKHYTSKKLHRHALKKSLKQLLQFKKIDNLSSRAGLLGQFRINPSFASVDTRTCTPKSDDSCDLVIESVITKHCYSDIAPKREAEEAKKRAPKDQNELRQRLNRLYDESLREFSAAQEARRYGYWKGTFFDTTVSSMSSKRLECTCGSELPEEEDTEYRVECNECGRYQHAKCVNYDLNDEYRGEYYCPQCWTTRPPVPSGATLIVSPASIADQWVSEIERHVGKDGLRVLFYKGSKSGFINPQKLASKYDLVVTTYSVLSAETNYLDLPNYNTKEGKAFRNAKRFLALSAALPCVQWWRVCLDEAQMVENSTSETAKMALRLSAVNRWCITGTPIERSLRDLHGLFVFLKLDPYNDFGWFNKCLLEPFKRGKKGPFESVLPKVLWRTEKKDVSDQLGVPPRSESVHFLRFSPIEEHFYRRQHVELSAEAIKKISRVEDLDTRLSQIDRRSLTNLMAPVLKLRQTCCHPMVAKGAHHQVNEKSVSMEQLLDQMITKTKNECEDTHRLRMLTINALAGLDIIDGNFAQASEHYREALRLSEELKGQVKTDSLQQIHALTNLSELLNGNHTGIARTLEDDSLMDKAQKLREKYLEKYETSVKSATDSLRTQCEAVIQLRNQLSSSSSSSSFCWYETLLRDVKSESDEVALHELMVEEMSQFYDVVNNREVKKLQEKYASSVIILSKIVSGTEQIERDITVSNKSDVFVLSSLRDGLESALFKLSSSDTQNLVNQAIDCHLRPVSSSSSKKRACRLCCLNDQLSEYESNLFHFIKSERKSLEQKSQRKELDNRDVTNLKKAGIVLLEEQRRGTWASSETERLLLALLKYGRHHRSSMESSVLKAANTHMSLFESLKKEFRVMRVLNGQLFDRVAAMDELNMSTMRMRLRFDDEPATKTGRATVERGIGDLSTRSKDTFENNYILERHEVDLQRHRMRAEKIAATSTFNKLLGQLGYLENLKVSDYGQKKGAENPDLCPVCRCALGREWAVFQCGHCYCSDCVEALQSRGGIMMRNISCPVCRASTHLTAISFVSTHGEEENENPDESDNDVVVRGSLSTKIEGVVKTLLRISKGDPEAKSLVFSTWPSSLEILGHALSANDIVFTSLCDRPKFKRNLLKFKTRKDVKVLLLPITSGSHGLNLTEANHVLLVEPLFNTAQELQAIGRVHRMGQKKKTTIHRFVVKNTIEQRMHNILSSFRLDETELPTHLSEENVLSVRDLKKIFVDVTEDESNSIHAHPDNTPEGNDNRALIIDND